MVNENEKVVNGQDIYEVLNSITDNALEKKKRRGIDFRFFDKIDKEKIDKSKVYKKVEELENKLKEYGITVEFYENIDMKDTSKGHKFFFRIYDVNDCFIEIDALEYRKAVVDGSVSEEDYIADKLVNLQGLLIYTNALSISKLVAELISYIYYFDDLQYKIYKEIGWSVRNEKELIFKYDRIYSSGECVIPSICMNKIASYLSGDYDESKRKKWKNHFADLINSCDEARVIISAACTGLIRAIMPYNKENNINMNIIGKPGSGKSSLCQFALSIFGNPYMLEGSFIDKDNAMEIIRVERPVIPYVLDDRLLKIDKLSEESQSRELLFDIFREYEGKVTERAGGAYKNISGGRTYAPIISSSVESMMDILLKSGDDLGQYRRFIEIEIKKDKIFGGDSSVVAEYQRMAYQNYGIGIQYIIEYILSVGVGFINNLYKQNLQDISEKLKEKEKQEKIHGLDSSAPRFALIATTYMVIREAINDSNKTSEENDYKLVGEDIETEVRDDIRIRENYLIMREIICKEDAGQVVDEKTKNDINTKLEYLGHSSKMDKVQVDFIRQKPDCYYDSMIDYLIKNLLEKMKRATAKVNVYENAIKFIENPLNDKWFSSEKKTNFFKDKTSRYIAIKKETQSGIKITFKGKKYIEWLFCAGLDLSDEQIEEYLKAVQDNDHEILAHNWFGQLVSKDIRVEIEKQYKDNKLVTFVQEKDAGQQRNIYTILIQKKENKESTSNAVK